jgi:hypothetical protein
MYLPNFAAEQPGATYYYSPLNVYPFGIVDCSTNPSKLTAMIFYEGMGKKGGNTVVSCIWKFLQLKGLHNGKTAHEISFVFNNCAGQNKDRMVTRFLFKYPRQAQDLSNGESNLRSQRPHQVLV